MEQNTNFYINYKLAEGYFIVGFATIPILQKKPLPGSDFVN